MKAKNLPAVIRDFIYHYRQHRRFHPRIYSIRWAAFFAWHRTPF